MSATPHSHTTTGGHAQVGHVVPLRLLIGVLLVLLALTFVTVAITWVDLGPFNLVAALAIAWVKATLVLLYFMHLRWDRPINAVIIVSSLFLFVIFIGFSLLDRAAYQPELIPGYAPDVKP